jgi:response regulator RpfG family c-di-GMP phosphodiesterase
MRFFRRPRLGRALLVAAVTAVGAAAALQFSGALEGLERRSLAARFEVRGERPATGIAVVGIDDVTFSDLERSWPFPRSLHAQVVDRLRAAGAKLIVYDVQFTEPTRPAQDFALYRAIGRAGGAVLATTEIDERGRTNVLGGDRNLARIDSVAASSKLSVDPDGTKSRFEHTDHKLRTIAVTAAERAGAPALHPSDFPAGGAWIDYRGPRGTFPTLSFSDVLAGRFDASVVRGKVVVIGATAPSLQDVHATPTAGEQMAGPELQANAIWTAIHGLPLRSAPPLVDLALVLLLALIPALLATRLRIVTATFVSGALAVAYVVAAQLAFNSGVVVAVAAPLTGIALATVLAIVASHVAESRARRREAERAEELERRVRERTSELRETQLEIVQRLARAADSRDEETGDHIDRIGRLCEELALAVGMAEAEAELLRHAASMHDIGKIGIRDHVLLKPGALDSDEWEQMKTHTVIGARLLSGSRSELLQLAETIALTHHERWDGSGYPAGLAGREIPLAGRICAVCDVYDALMSTRPYKRAWSREEALAEIRRGAGTHFDPRLADTFLGLRAAESGDELAEWPLDPPALMDIRPTA